MPEQNNNPPQTLEQKIKNGIAIFIAIVILCIAMYISIKFNISRCPPGKTYIKTSKYSGICI